MRYFLRRRVPPFDRVLLVESGSRDLLEKLIPRLRRDHGARIVFDLVTCYAGRPWAIEPGPGKVYRVTAYSGRTGRKRLYRELAARRHSVAVLICSGEPIMTKWKWALALRLPVKVLIVNENTDYFWLDRGSWPIIRRFVFFRTGLTGAGAVRTLARLAAFPFTLAYLIFYTAIVHLRRKVHL